jgi:hypothetical protein
MPITVQTLLPMRAFFIFMAFAIQAMATASAQQMPPCGSPVNNYLPTLPAPGQAYVGVATDLKGLSPIKPAIIVNVQLPARAQPLVAQGYFALRAGSSLTRLEVARTEIHVLGAGPRAPVVVPEAALFSSRSDAYLTQYKLFIRVPPEAAEQFVVVFPEWLSANARLSIPPLAFHRLDSDPGIEICSVLPARG